MATETLKIEVDTAGVESAIDALNRLTEAAQRAEKALRELGEQPHGGVRLEAVEGIVEVTIKPFDASQFHAKVIEAFERDGRRRGPGAA